MSTKGAIPSPKHAFWDKKHKEIAAKFGVSVKTIIGLRHYAIHKRMTRGEIIMHINAQSLSHAPVMICPTCRGKGKIRGQSHPRIVHEEQINLIKRATEQEWKDIVYPYRFEE